LSPSSAHSGCGKPTLLNVVAGLVPARSGGVVLMALLEAAQWLELPENRLEAAEIIARGSYVDAPVEVVTKRLKLRPGCGRK
jgi:energy-coupling factor transporter ATP-binding protein EcfA2